MQNDNIASRYASALLMLAVDNNQVKEYQSQMRDFLAILKDNNELVKILNHYKINHQDKFQLLDKLLKASYQPEVINFLKLLIQKRRFNHIDRVIGEFNQLANAELGILDGVVYSAKPLSSQQIEQLVIGLKQKHQLKVELINRIDERLIGGYKIVIKDKVFDGTLKYRVELLRTELSEGKR